MRLNRQEQGSSLPIPKKEGRIRKFLTNFERKTQAFVERKADARVAKILKDPMRHKRAIRLEFERTLHEATKTPKQDAARARRDSLQLSLYPLSHIPFPLPINLLSIPAIPVFHGIPLILSSVVTVGFYNIPNTLEAIKQKRIGKTLAYGGLTALSVFPLPLPFVLNSITYDVALRSINREGNKRILDYAHTVLAHPESSNPAEYQAFAHAFQEFIKRKGDSLNERLEKSLTVARTQKELARNEKVAERLSQQEEKNKLTQKVRIYRNFKRKRLGEIVDDKVTAINQLQQLLQLEQTSHAILAA